MLSNTLLITAIATLATSTPLLANRAAAPVTDPRFTAFHPPGTGDVRSPCPGLNALANHNFIHHSGRNLTIPDLITGLSAGLNIGADFTVVISALGLLSSPAPLAGNFDLDDLDQHNFPIEHDASLSRQDAYFGDDHSFYDPNWQMVLSHFGDAETTSIQTASDGKWARVNDSMARNPTFTYGLREAVLSYGETALYLQTMSDPVSGVARVDFVRELFENEKLPVDLGWQPSASPVTLASLGAMIVQLYSANPAAAPEGVEILADSYKNVLEVAVGGSEVLANLTDGLSSILGL